MLKNELHIDHANAYAEYLACEESRDFLGMAKAKDKMHDLERKINQENLKRDSSERKTMRDQIWNYVTHGNPNTYRDEQDIIDHHRRIRSEAEQ
jgi:hypothetical protein